MPLDLTTIHTDFLREYMRIKEYKEAGALLLKYSQWKRVMPVEIPTTWLIEQTLEVIGANNVQQLATLFDQHVKNKLKEVVRQRLAEAAAAAKQEVYYALSEMVPRGTVLKATAQVAWLTDYVIIHPHDLEEYKKLSAHALVWIPLEEQHQDPSVRAKYN